MFDLINLKKNHIKLYVFYNSKHAYIHVPKKRLDLEYVLCPYYIHFQIMLISLYNEDIFIGNWKQLKD